MRVIITCLKTLVKLPDSDRLCEIVCRLQLKAMPPSPLSLTTRPRGRSPSRTTCRSSHLTTTDHAPRRAEWAEPEWVGGTWARCRPPWWPRRAKWPIGWPRTTPRWCGASPLRTTAKASRATCRCILRGWKVSLVFLCAICLASWLISGQN